MPFYDYLCCGAGFERRVDMDDRDRVRCGTCGKLAKRVENYNFSIGNATYVAADRFKGIEFATGVRGIENLHDAEKALEAAGAQPVDAYYRAPKPPPPKEVTIEELAPYLDGMPLNNEPIRE